MANSIPAALQLPFSHKILATASRLTPTASAISCHDDTAPPMLAIVPRPIGEALQAGFEPEQRKNLRIASGFDCLDFCSVALLSRKLSARPYYQSADATHKHRARARFGNGNSAQTAHDGARAVRQKHVIAPRRKHCETGNGGSRG
jgi:hypothetical protein